VWGFLAGLMWAIMQKHYVLAFIFAIFLTLSHYGIAYYTLFVLSFTFAVLMVIKLCHRYKRNMAKIQGLKVVTFTLIVLAISIGCWYTLVNSRTGQIVSETIEKSVDIGVSKPSQGESQVESQVESNFWVIHSRDKVTQSILGVTFPYMNTPQRIEFIISWLIVSVISAGLVMAFMKKQLTLTHRIIALGMYGATVVTLLLPHLSATHGVVRSGFSGFVGYSVFYVICCNQISKKFKINKYILPSSILVIYGLCVSGAIHLLFGIVK